MKNVLKVVFVIIGTLVGAGFASGQEIYIFFYSHGIQGILGLILSSILMGLIIYKTLKVLIDNDVTNYKEFVDVIVKKQFKYKYLNFKNIFSLIINIFILMTFFVMIAGFGAYFKQEFNINNYIGSTILAVLCYFVFKKSVRGLVKINEILIPILLIFIFTIGIINVFKIDITASLAKLGNRTNSNWIIDSILYTSYNSIILIPTLLTMKRFIKNKGNIRKITVISIAIMMSISILLFFILLGVSSSIYNVEMPIVFAVSKLFKILTYIYGFVIIASIFTTSISLGISFLQNFDKNKKSYTHIAGIMCITAVAVSNFGFSTLVGLLYPIFGYLGLLQIIKLLTLKQ